MASDGLLKGALVPFKNFTPIRLSYRGKEDRDRLPQMKRNASDTPLFLYSN
jgi:hypothetical protein